MEAVKALYSDGYSRTTIVNGFTVQMKADIRQASNAGCMMRAYKKRRKRKAVINEEKLFDRLSNNMKK